MILREGFQNLGHGLGTEGDRLWEHRLMFLSFAYLACGVPKLCSQRGIIRICRRNRVLTPDTDDAEKLRS